MAGVFEVEVDGVEHDHGLGHQNEADQVRGILHSESDIKPDWRRLNRLVQG